MFYLHFCKIGKNLLLISHKFIVCFHAEEIVFTYLSLKLCQQFFLCFIAVLGISYIITYAQANDLYADRI